MKNIIIIDDQIFLSLLHGPLLSAHKSIVIMCGARPLQAMPDLNGITIQHLSALTKSSLLNGVDFARCNRVIVGLRCRMTLKRCLDIICSGYGHMPVVVIDTGVDGLNTDHRYENLFVVSLNDMIAEKSATMIQAHEDRKKINQLLEINRDAEKILILLQHDPDPDAIASGLALRILLGRNKQTAPIGTFGGVTRSENLNMIKLLDIPLVKLEPGDLKNFSKIALLDVQPPYFKGIEIKADIVIDHHPCNEPYDADFSDIRVAYGSTATILSEYLINGEYKITQRLATALVYGIKTDTMFLDRDISSSDIDIFAYLYPKVNLNVLRQIEHANLEISEVGGFVKALKNIVIVEDMLFTYLGSVQKEDIIPRIADFCLQIGAVQWAFVSGVFNNNMVCCVRNVGYVKHAGELAGRAFGEIGSAGGHRSMAKAVVPANTFKRVYRISSRREFAAKIIEVICHARDED